MAKQFYSTIDKTLSGTIIPDQFGSGNNDNERLFHIPQKSRGGGNDAV